MNAHQRRKLRRRNERTRQKVRESYAALMHQMIHGPMPAHPTLWGDRLETTQQLQAEIKKVLEQIQAAHFAVHRPEMPPDDGTHGTATVADIDGDTGGLRVDRDPAAEHLGVFLPRLFWPEGK